MQIREYEPGDLESCRRLWAEMTQRHRDIYDDPTIGGEDPGAEFDGHLEMVGPARVWVAVLEAEVVELVSLIQEGEQAEVEPIAVSSRHRGQRIGQRLLQHVTDKARELGVLCSPAAPHQRFETRLPAATV